MKKVGTVKELFYKINSIKILIGEALIPNDIGQPMWDKFNGTFSSGMLLNSN